MLCAGPIVSRNKWVKPSAGYEFVHGRCYGYVFMYTGHINVNEHMFQ